MGEFLESRGMFNLKVDKNARKGMTDDELIKKLTGEVDEAYGVDDAMKRKLDQEDIDKAIEQEDILLNFDIAALKGPPALILPVFTPSLNVENNIFAIGRI